LTRSFSSRVRRAIRIATGHSPWPSGGLVLLYHRVTTLDRDPHQLAVTPERFADHLGVLCRHGRPMTLASLVAERGTLPSGAFAITFDDGYADVLETAAPLLADAGVPATVFVTAGGSDVGREFWWDELERHLLDGARLPARLTLPIDGAAIEWDASSETARQTTYVDLCARLRRMTGASRRRTLDALAAITGVPIEPRPSHRRLSNDQIAALSRSSGITIGSHTMSHSALAGIPADERQRELAGAKSALEAVTGTAVNTMAYPFGGASDLPDGIAVDARAAGVTLACTTQPDSVRVDTDPLHVPRLVIRNWAREEFSARWSSWTQ
jgi:peptidoglycan/xylan/chitin deacetylase (PgdA/CDA1 family)